MQEMQNAVTLERGLTVVNWDGHAEKGYELMNSIDSTQEGFTLQEWFGAGGIIIKHFIAAKAA